MFKPRHGTAESIQNFAKQSVTCVETPEETDDVFLWVFFIIISL